MNYDKGTCLHYGLRRLDATRDTRNKNEVELKLYWILHYMTHNEYDNSINAAR